MNMKGKEELNIVIRLPKEHFEMYKEYIKNIKVKGSTVMHHNLQILLKGTSSTLEEFKKEGKNKR